MEPDNFDSILNPKTMQYMRFDQQYFIEHEHIEFTDEDNELLKHIGEVEIENQDSVESSSHGVSQNDNVNSLIYTVLVIIFALILIGYKLVIRKNARTTIKKQRKQSRIVSLTKGDKLINISLF